MLRCVEAMHDLASGSLPPQLQIDLDVFTVSVLESAYWSGQLVLTDPRIHDAAGVAAVKKAATAAAAAMCRSGYRRQLPLADRIVSVLRQPPVDTELEAVQLAAVQAVEGARGGVGGNHSQHGNGSGRVQAEGEKGAPGAHACDAAVPRDTAFEAVLCKRVAAVFERGLQLARGLGATDSALEACGVLEPEGGLSSGGGGAQQGHAGGSGGGTAPPGRGPEFRSAVGKGVVNGAASDGVADAAGEPRVADFAGHAGGPQLAGVPQDAVFGWNVALEAPRRADGQGQGQAWNGSRGAAVDEEMHVSHGTAEGFGTQGTAAVASLADPPDDGNGPADADVIVCEAVEEAAAVQNQSSRVLSIERGTAVVNGGVREQTGWGSRPHTTPGGDSDSLPEIDSGSSEEE